MPRGLRDNAFKIELAKRIIVAVLGDLVGSAGMSIIQDGGKRC